MSDTFQTFFLMQNMYFSKILKVSGLNKGKKMHKYFDIEPSIVRH